MKRTTFFTPADGSHAGVRVFVGCALRGRSWGWSGGKEGGAARHSTLIRELQVANVCPGLLGETHTLCESNVALGRPTLNKSIRKNS